MSEPTVTTLPVGQVLDSRYRIDGILGTGGLGVVYRAQHLGLDRPVALKMLHTEFGGVAEIHQRFTREAKALSTLVHPNIVAITDFGTVEAGPYLTMELLEGKTLADLLEEGPFDPDHAIDVVIDALRGLEFAHVRGVLHRDLKPGNVFIADFPDGGHQVKLLDFGLAKIGDAGADAPPAPTLTRLGTVLGTPSYMSPEQASSSVADPRSDVYSMGVVLYEMLTGRRPFEEANRFDTIRAHLVKEVPNPGSKRPGLVLTQELRAFLMKALAKMKDNRFANGAEMRAAAEALPRPVARLSKEPRVASTESSQTTTGEEATVLAGARDRSPRRGSPLRRRPRAVVAAAAVAVALAGLLTIVAVWLALAGDSDDVAAAAAPHGDDRAERAEQASSKTHPGRTASRPPAVDRLARAPRGLAGIYGRVRRGRELTDAQLRTLRRFQQEHPDDATASLLLAHDHVGRLWLTAALERYAIVDRIDPAARGTPWMQEDLLLMAATSSHGQRAAALLVDIYGDEALRIVESGLSRRGLDATARARLERLRERLAEH